MGTLPKKTRVTAGSQPPETHLHHFQTFHSNNYNNATLHLMPKNTNTLALKLTSDIIDKLQSRSVKHRDIAEELKVSPTHLSRTLAEKNYKRTPSPLVIQRKNTSLLYQTRAESREALAKRVIDKLLDLKEAQELAGCSERTLRRYVAKLK